MTKKMYRPDNPWRANLRKIGPIIALILLALLLRIHRLGAQSLWYDELFTVLVAQEDNLSDVLEAVARDVHPPLHYLLLYAVTYLGESENFARIISVIAGTLSVLILYRIGNILFNHRVAWLAAALLGLSSMHVFYSQEARMYALFSLFSLVGIDRLLILIERPTKWNAVLLALVNTLNLYTHYFALFIMLMQLIWIVSIGMRNLIRFSNSNLWSFQSVPRGSFFRSTYSHLFFISIVLVLLSFSPWIGTVIGQVTKSAGQGITHAIPPGSGFFLEIAVAFGGGRLGAMILIALLVISAIFIRHQQAAWVAWGWVILPCLMAYAVQLFFPVVTVRNLIFLLPIVHLIVANSLFHLIDRLADPKSGKYPILISLAIGLILLPFVTSLMTYYKNPESVNTALGLTSKPAWRQASVVLETEMTSNDLLIYPGLARNKLPIEYYLGTYLLQKSRFRNFDQPIHNLWYIGESFTFRNFPQPIPAAYEETESWGEYNRITINKYSGSSLLKPYFGRIQFDGWDPKEFQRNDLMAVLVIPYPNSVEFYVREDDQNFALVSPLFDVVAATPFYLAAEVTGADKDVFNYAPRVEIQFRDSQDKILINQSSDLLLSPREVHGPIPVFLSGVVPEQASQARVRILLNGLRAGRVATVQSVQFWGLER